MYFVCVCMYVTEMRKRMPQMLTITELMSKLHSY